MESSVSNINDNFAFDSLQSIRNRLLDLTGRNRLLNFRHGSTGFIRVIDEMPDQLAENILEGSPFTFIPIEEPKVDELVRHGYISFDEQDREQRIKPSPNAKEWAKLKGFNTNFELPLTERSKQAKHNDKNIQSILYPRELEAQLRNIRTKANTAIEETGANILYLAFGFLEWYEDENSSVPRLAPLYLIPVRIERASLNKELGTYTYTIEYTGEDIIPNLSLREKLRHDFHLELPELNEDTLPEHYLSEVEKLLLRHKQAWKVKRFSTLAMFDFGKLLMYLDLDPARWPQDKTNIQSHPILQQFFAKQGSDEKGSGSSFFSEEYLIDSLEEIHEKYPLIDDADSSQHSALVDAIKGKNLVIEGPPGSGKSQTITNLIAAAMSQGKKVLFVAEKMAALQVVQSRLARAGLGDFCLELHSSKTQKKQVYENLAKRLNNQNVYRYPDSIDIDIEMYEEKKALLSEYAELINSSWKNTGKSIHQIFSAATRYREEFTKLDVESVKPKYINGDNFDEISARRIIDELTKYVSVFQEVKAQLGAEADISQHPWAGVYNKSIQLFDCDDIARLLSEWNSKIESLIDTLQPLNQRFGTELELNLDDLALLIKDKSALPELTGEEYLSSLKYITEAEASALTEYLELYLESKKLYEIVSASFESEVFESDYAYSNLNNAHIILKECCKNNDILISDIFKHLQSATELSELSNSIADDIKLLVSNDPSLKGLLTLSVSGLNEARTYLAHISALGTGLISRRDKLFDNDLLEHDLTSLNELLPKIKARHERLENYFELAQLPTVSELIEIERILKSAGFFCWLSSEWRAAKTKLISFAKGLKPNFKKLAPLVPELVIYRKQLDKLLNNPDYQANLKHEFRGLDTSVEELIQIREWYKSVRASYGIGFGKKVALANSLFSIEADIFKGIEHLGSSKLIEKLTRFFDVYENLGLIFDDKVFKDKEHDFATNNGIHLFAANLETATKNVQKHIKDDGSLCQLTSAIEQLTFFKKQESLLAEKTITKELFGDNVYLSTSADSEATYSKIQATLNLSQKINLLDSDLLKEYLINDLTADKLAATLQDLEHADNAFKAYKKAYLVFREKVELDDSLWLKNIDDSLIEIQQRNNTAISQPKWLSTWIDFIRVRESLCDKGLDNLLLSAERGMLALSNIEQVYLYAIYDILSREIINENQKLAYFSGADQNAVRKQFQEYDNKLKSLQQEKIAFEVAHRGITQTLAGNASGKVSTFTEMGLIMNEVNKKTRHVPIRQLVNRAGKSLAALKPCFMMGPHSVAQYLTPGQIEFDLIVMDEASQIKPEDALGTIARGKQLVVVGDPKQLPPTSFFDKAVDNEDEDTTAIEQSESILDVSLPMFNARRLRWHYRSRHESLIAFSNQEFYDNNLIVFPSPSNKSDEFGVKFTYVRNGRFVNQHNIEEARTVAEAVRAHLLNHSTESLGVVAMSSKQREQIERCVEELSKEDALFRNKLAENANNEEPLFIKNLENVQGDERDVIYISCTYGPQEAGAAHMPQRFGPINSAAGGRRLNVLFTRSKKRMHIFSSMTEGHINVSETSNTGVIALKSFLSFAQTGKLQQQIHTGKEPDSDFEIAVMNALKLEGFTCVPQVGVAGYFIDLAVQDPGQPGRFIMGVECDGATYHSAKSARDRDRLRQSVLESLGWNIKRIWSTDWFKNPEAQLKPIIEQLHQLKTSPAEHAEVESEVSEITKATEHEESAFNELHQVIDVNDSLEAKLTKLQNTVLKSNEVAPSQSLFRPAMVAALCEYRPISKSEFLEFIPEYLRSGTSKKHGCYLDQVLRVIAGEEEDLT
ncbi:DUF4011 domain-containing anti-phage protein Hhe [Pseudoalteromonas sp. BZB3]|uniref:DUF4011 domain-containing anti-phage protein Hhe n=1 Tax=Pseudoalteromonas sp. BZB3 TaxID=3136670 RepID=UPI0032C42361